MQAIIHFNVKNDVRWVMDAEEGIEQTIVDYFSAIF